MHQNRVYIVDKEAKYLDFDTKTWQPWPAPIYYMEWEACIVLWRDSFLMLGNNRYQSFNLTTQKWTAFNSTSPSSLWASTCIVLPNEKVLLAGTTTIPAKLYNPVTNTWTQLSTQLYSRDLGSFVNLNGRIFLLGGNTTLVEEFNITTGTWMKVDPTLRPSGVNQWKLVTPTSPRIPPQATRFGSGTSPPHLSRAPNP